MLWWNPINLRTCSIIRNMIIGARFGCIREGITVLNLLVVMCTSDVPLKPVDSIVKILGKETCRV